MYGPHVGQALNGCSFCLFNRGMDTEMWYIYTMEYYSAIKNKYFMKFIGKWMDLENIILSEKPNHRKTHMLCTH